VLLAPKLSWLAICSPRPGFSSSSSSCHRRKCLDVKIHQVENQINATLKRAAADLVDTVLT
jgi:hypothetical protein